MLPPPLEHLRISPESSSPVWAGGGVMDPNPHRNTSPHSTYPLSSVPFRLDEGFSEASPSQDETEHNASIATVANFQNWVMAQDEEQRSEIAYEVLRTLRTSSMAAIVERLTPFLYMDPVRKLPPEIIAEIFTYLDARTLLVASLASRAWRERILDSRLWRQLYEAQGWSFDLDMIKGFDNADTISSFRHKGKGKSHLRGSSSSGNSQPHLKKRATSGWLEDRNRKISADASHWREQHERIEADINDVNESEDQDMQDAPPAEVEYSSPKRRNKRHSQDSGDEMVVFSPQRYPQSMQDYSFHSADDLHPPIKPTLINSDGTRGGALNWNFLYKQRRRLEENWSKGRYTNFQLPHPQYAHEAHTECVYAIQFYGKWLVSGSRDKTVRVWDLETKRLRGAPLWGHTQSVLCLQFDPTEDEDVIISGSSDNGVIVWQFSTGQKLYEIPQAHNESVLNLRFDKRYLVTCSKDKVVKIWNRHEMLPTDPDYPRKSAKSETKLPTHIIDISQFSPKQMHEVIDLQGIKPLRPYSNIMILAGHTAAVNAIQIDGDKVVSASGDRSIKIWDVRSGELLRTISGHNKGIACVQFDSRRIVSGSSDNTVRIYDPTTGAELAILQGHTNLVRTVQAGFGDPPGNEEELDLQARAAERAFVEGVRMGTIDEVRPRSRRRGSNANEPAMSSLAPVSFGAHLPPGGGGTQWGRIVSGSYDETIIIWRKDANGDWVIGHRLRQDSAVRALNDANRNMTPAPRSNLPTMAPGIGAVAMNGAANMPIPSATQIVHQAIGASMAGLSNGIQNVVNVGNLLGGSLAAWNAQNSHPANLNALAGPHPQHGAGWLPPGAQQAMHQLNAHVQNVVQAYLQAQAQAQAQEQGPNGSTTQAGSSNQPQEAVGQTTHQATTTTATQRQMITTTTHQATTNPQPTAPPAPPQAHHNPNPPNPANPNPAQPHPLHPQSVSRVFKLQFDARRIVCCSQDSRIVGWDFANGDPEIEEASAFFIGP